MKDWKDIHPVFEGNIGDYYQEKWKGIGFDAQKTKEWINAGLEVSDYDKVSLWENMGFDSKETKKWIKVGLSPDNAPFAFYLKNSGFVPQCIAEFKNKNAQEWVDYFYPNEKRKKITSLHINLKWLENSLIIDSWTSLESIDCRFSKITKLSLINLPKLSKVACNVSKVNDLEISNCPNISNLSANNSQISNLDFLNQLNPRKLTSISINDNKFPPYNLIMLSKFRKLEYIFMGDTSFYGSLKPLQGLFKLKCLHICNTNIDEGLEYLPESLENFFYSDCKAIEKQLSPYSGNIKNWKKTHKRQVEVAESAKIRCLAEALTTLDQEIEELEKENEYLRSELVIEREHAEAMDNFYRQNPPNENTSLYNILSEISSDYLRINQKNKQKEQEVRQLNDKLKAVVKIAEQNQTKNDYQKTLLLAEYRENLKQLTTNAESKLNEEGQVLLIILLEAQVEVIQNSNPFAKKQLENIKKELNKKLSQEEIKVFLDKQAKIVKLEKQLEYLNLESKIEQYLPS